MSSWMSLSWEKLHTLLFQSLWNADRSKWWWEYSRNIHLPDSIKGSCSSVESDPRTAFSLSLSISYFKAGTTTTHKNAVNYYKGCCQITAGVFLYWIKLLQASAKDFRGFWLWLTWHGSINRTINKKLRGCFGSATTHIRGHSERLRKLLMSLRQPGDQHRTKTER